MSHCWKRETAFLPKVDRDIAASMLEALNRKRINVRLNARVQSVYDTAEGITLTYTDSANGTPYYLKGDALLVAIGRKPMTAELNLEKAGIQTDKRGSHRCRQPITDYSPTRMGPGGT